MTTYVITKNTDITPSATEGFSLVKVDEETQVKLNIAQKVLDTLVEDGCHGSYVLGDTIWNEFQAAFAKAD